MISQFYGKNAVAGKKYDVINMTGKKITITIDADVYKKLKVKATINDETVNTYINTILAGAVDDVDLNAIIKSNNQ